MNYTKALLALLLAILLCASLVSCKKDPAEAPPQDAGSSPTESDTTPGGTGDTPPAEQPPATVTALPNTAGGKSYKSVYDAFNNTNMLYWDSLTEADAKAYGDTVAALGYTLVSTTDNASLWAATYQKDGSVAHVYFLKKLGELRALDSIGAALPTDTSRNEKICKAQITQLGSVESIGHVIRLEDGSFVIVDGGGDNSYDAAAVYNRLCELNALTGADKLVIRAWFITHSDKAHYGVLAQFLDKYDTDVKIDVIVANDPTDAIYRAMGSIPNGLSYSSMEEFFGGCTFIKAHTGYQFRFAGLTMNILYTHEDANELQTTSLDSRISMVFDAVAGDTRLLWLGDLETDGAARLAAMYGTDLACDILQVSSGENSGSEELYRLCAPSTVLWTGSADEVNAVKALPKNAYLTETASNVYYAYNGSKVIVFESYSGGSTGTGGGSVDEDGSYSKDY